MTRLTVDRLANKSPGGDIEFYQLCRPAAENVLEIKKMIVANLGWHASRRKQDDN